MANWQICEMKFKNKALKDLPNAEVFFSAYF